MRQNGPLLGADRGEWWRRLARAGSTLTALQNYYILYYKMSVKEEPTREGSKRSQLYKGIAEVVLLSLLKDGSRYGLEILEQLRSIARLSLADGTIYPLLYRLERTGLVASEWRFDTKGIRPRKYYKLTKRGNAELKVLLQEWRELSSNLDSFLNRQ
jgi:PadR family transcriptional regulator PadR